MPLSAVSPTTVHHFEIDSPIDSTSPTNLTHEEMLSDLSSALAKKKKKKKPKKAKTLSPISVSPTAVTEVKQQVLCISRNKHWRYISSYHVCPSFSNSRVERVKFSLFLDRVLGYNYHLSY
ncbi:hypothetical protein FRC20_009212 [Serendipita sp. 405]|nr:hypothetical protein FRC15_007360 [Serendipita sp. 397]KAG8865976.1 hypothetical protein FRC20_009212 [Serendipita sp. 405]